MRGAGEGAFGPHVVAVSVEVEGAPVERFVVRLAPVGAQAVALVLGALPSGRLARAAVTNIQSVSADV